MKYIYYPGCTLEGTAMEYNQSTKKVMEELGAELIELEDWTCCGASAAEAIGYLISLVLPARNLALAERIEGTLDLLIPCSACYLNLKKVEYHVMHNPPLKEKINYVLKLEDLTYNGGVRARHLLDIIARDIDPEIITDKVKNHLSGLVVAPYYGCQALRPYPEFDDPQDPKSMNALIRALGAKVFPWSIMGAKCCGAALMSTKKQVGIKLSGAILESAEGADCIVTVCPMCHMNLEAYQDQISRDRGRDLNISILYLPQLIGIAIGFDPNELGINKNLSITDEFKDKIGLIQ
jgi:heterodisulfide reductase subunit B